MTFSVSSLIIEVDGVTAIQVTCCVSLVEIVMSIVATVACAVAILQCGPKMFRPASGQVRRMVSRKQSAPERIFIPRSGKKYHRLASCAGDAPSSYDACLKCCRSSQPSE